LRLDMLEVVRMEETLLEAAFSSWGSAIVL
jgi:hypothetical protein